MEPGNLLRDIVIVFAVGLAVASLFRRLGLPSIAGFIVAGTLVGPRSLGLVGEAHDVEVLAEVGVVLLLFGIGLEISLERLRRLWKAVLVGGALQVGITLLGTFGVAVALGLSTRAGVFLGCLVAVSSTAVVLRGLETRGELDAPHGRLTLGILVFQDLCVVPMMLAVPFLTGRPGAAGNPWLAALKAAGVVAGVILASRRAVPRALEWVAGTRQRDLFLLSVLLVCLGTAWVLSWVGVSLPLGAFLAGLVVAGSEFRRQALSDLIPFREIFTVFFFMSIGMLLDPLGLFHDAPRILGLLIALLVGKFAVVFLVSLAMRLPLRVAVLAGVALSQVGEFSFVLSHAAGDANPLPSPLASDFPTAVTLSMLVTPMLLALGPRIAAGLGRSSALTRVLNVPMAEDPPEPLAALRDHVIIAGYGIAGEHLASSLKDAGVPYAIVDLNLENVRRAARMGEPAVFGDVTSPDVLGHLGADKARELVVVINDPGAAMRAAMAARKIAPNLAILVRSRYLADIGALRKAGATDVVAAEIESSAEITARVLSRHGVARSVIEREIACIRSRLGEKRC